MSMTTKAKYRRFVQALVTRTLRFEFERMPYCLENISSTKLLTLLRQEINYARKRPKPPLHPIHLQIEPSAVCSLHCNMCPAAERGGGKPGDVMPFSLLKSLIDETGDYAVVAVFWMWGEPFMNPKFTDMIAYARSKNIGTVTSTNGQHILTPEDAEAVVASGLDNLVIAVDGVTEEAYSRRRPGGDLKKVIRCLDLIVDAKKRLGSRRPGVNVRTVVTRENEDELAEIEEFARVHGADWISRKTACSLNCGDPSGDAQFVPRNEFYRRYAYDGGQRVRLPATSYRCRRQWRRMTVAADGVVMPCEFDSKRTATFGKYGEDGSFLEIWRGEKAARFREQFVVDRFAIPFCNACPIRDRLQSECTIEIERLSPQSLELT